MNLTGISGILSAIVATIPGTLYLRKTDTDANTSADNVDLKDKTVVLFNNLPEVPHLVFPTGSVVRQWPIEIKVLQLALLDDTTEQSDVIRDACLAVADEIWDKVVAHQDLPDAFEYEISFLNELKIYDKTLTGCTLKFILNIQRTSYKC